MVSAGAVIASPTRWASSFERSTSSWPVSQASGRRSGNPVTSFGSTSASETTPRMWFWLSTTGKPEMRCSISRRAASLSEAPGGTVTTSLVMTSATFIARSRQRGRRGRAADRQHVCSSFLLWRRASQRLEPLPSVGARSSAPGHPRCRTTVRLRSSSVMRRHAHDLPRPAGHR